MTSRYLQSIPPYVFWELDARRRAFREAGRELIDLGIGSPDQAIPQVVIEAVQSAATDRALSGYPYFRGHPRFISAAVDYMQSRFGVKLDPVTEIMALAGSKEGIAELILSHCNAGDVVLVPAIHYPVYARATMMAGAQPVFVPVEENGRLRLEDLDSDAIARTRIMIINYPCNPTTAIASHDELKSIVDFATRHDIILISDLAYSELSFDGYRVPSIFEIEGASQVAVEMHSCSKSFNMAGLRIAFVAGRADVLSTLDAYRSNIGYGVGTLSQVAGAAAFSNYRELVPPIVAEYRNRRDALANAMIDGGWDVDVPKATMYLWLDVPEGYGDWEWVDALMSGPGVVVTPGIAFGVAGTGKFRLSLVQPAPVLRSAAASLSEMLVRAVASR